MPKFGSFQGAWGNLMLMVYGLSMTPHDLIKYLQLPTKPVQAFFPGPFYDLEPSIRTKVDLISGPKLQADKKRIDSIIERMTKKLEECGPQAHKPAGSKGQLGRSDDDNTLARLARIKESKIKCLVITGTYDKLVNPAHSTTLSKQLDCKLILLKDIGLASVFEAPAETNKAIESIVLQNNQETRSESKM
eukprot:CAMPEP_0167772548 /NCGR_PEP_ID=MMETSP0111_2-20121227/909_1 /TAXON_ID=91324 /ORGANISM="Lotharella globosa, Strain CCCM811" /LENGTH=189 /DNA_ID=CAMNT_0007662053 /DNA_START=490 /DNA_END=1061 /DNA_ORIENTATION=+